MQSANRLQLALRKSTTTPTFGVWQMLPGTNLSRTLSRTDPSPDWLCIDTEHGNISDTSMHELVAAVAACQVSPVVRIPASEPWMIKRALDAGAHAIIVPLIHTADDARRVVQAAKFPPVGTRGFGSPLPMEKFRTVGGAAPSQQEYLQQSNDSLVTIVQIETKEALQNVRDIASVPGIDVLFIGPFDLGNNIGAPVLDGVMADALKDAVAEIHEAAKEAGKVTGIYCTSGEQAREYADKGFRMISAVTDVPALAQSVGSALRTAHGGWGHTAYLGVKEGVSKLTGGSSGGKK